MRPAKGAEAHAEFDGDVGAAGLISPRLCSASSAHDEIHHALVGSQSMTDDPAKNKVVGKEDQLQAFVDFNSSNPDRAKHCFVDGTGDFSPCCRLMSHIYKCSHGASVIQKLYRTAQVEVGVVLELTEKRRSVFTQKDVGSAFQGQVIRAFVLGGRAQVGVLVAGAI